MAEQEKIAVVTGGNKGIGLAIVRNLALEYPKSSLQPGRLVIYLTARSNERGQAALKELQSDSQLSRVKVLEKDGGNVKITFHALDISQTKSIQDFRDHLKQAHTDGIDIVINNAGIALEGFDTDVVKHTLETNYYGTLEATQDLLPLLRPDGRLVNVSSASGKLNKYSSDVREAFLKAAETDVPAVTSLMESFKSAVAEGREKEAGFPSAAYAVSKAGVTAMTKAIAKKEASNGRNVLINACCPGYVNTDMTRGGGTNTPDEGATTPVLLALGDIKGVTGGFWQSEKQVEW
ncbi:hypothetical protein AMS68_001232 [Peltaster fructicola]|uniref:Carbonyl reductase n=1 Tax=Peltaster fructicola TaxID=286661 RepID=A0A6H0XM58_9PEZI|nr:hypothetical protein AMS68_001232 [Peltaster fructicola]